MKDSVLVMPKILCNSVFVAGLDQPLSAIVDVLEAQNRPEHARAVRSAMAIVDCYVKGTLDKTHEIILS
jgi:hypothetical protein